MRGHTHAVTGVAVSILISQKLGIRFDTVSAAVSVIASLLPDADEQHSTINKHIPLHYGKVVYAVGAAALFYQAYKTSNILLVVPAIVAFLIYVSGHRGFTHSILACGIMGLPLLSNLTVFVQFAAAYMTHLACDMLNTKGIQLLYPMKKRYKLPVNFTMDSILGQSVEIIASGISGLIIVRSFF